MLVEDTFSGFDASTDESLLKSVFCIYSTKCGQIIGDSGMYCTRILI